MRSQGRAQFAAMLRRAVQRKLGDTAYVILERACFEGHRGDLARLVDSRGESLVRRGVVGSVHHEDRRAVSEVALSARNLFSAHDKTLDRFERQIGAVRINIWQIDR